MYSWSERRYAFQQLCRLLAAWLATLCLTKVGYLDGALVRGKRATQVPQLRWKVRVAKVESDTALCSQRCSPGRLGDLSVQERERYT